MITKETRFQGGFWTEDVKKYITLSGVSYNNSKTITLKLDSVELSLVDAKRLVDKLAAMIVALEKEK